MTTPAIHTVMLVQPHIMGSDIPAWLVGVQGPDPTILPGAVGISLLEINARAAEYGFTDLQEIIDVILHERHMSPQEADVTSPDFLYNTSKANALIAHRARIKSVKQRVTIVDPQGMLGHITHTFDQDLIADIHAHAEYERRERLRLRAIGFVAPKMPHHLTAPQPPGTQSPSTPGPVID